MAKRDKTKSKIDTAPHQGLDPGTVAMLLEMAEWWKDNKGKLLQPLPLARPRFRRGAKTTTTRSIRLSKKMIEEAVKKAKKEQGRTGGTLNSLIEVLIWEYLGRPADLLEPDGRAIEQPPNTDTGWA